MQSEDSFNDSDEIFNLYSSKNITKTFKAQFQKLLASKPQNGKSTVVECSSKTEESPTEVSSDLSILFVNGNDEINSSIDSPIEVIPHSSSEDEIKVIEDNPTRKATRRSLRLKQKRNLSCRRNSVRDSSISSNKQIKSKKKQARKNKMKKKVDEVFIQDSPESTNSFDEDELNPEVSVKVIWKSVSIKRFTIRKFQKMSRIFEELSKNENIPVDKIMLTFNNVKVNKSDTPDSLNLQVYHFLDGGVLNERTQSSLPESKSSSLDENSITLKFQDFNKKVIKITLGKNEKIKVGMIKCSEQLEVPFKKIKFFFDGELIEPSQTPSSLGLENDEIIDIKICE